MQSSKSPRHQAALDFAAQGIPVFPCQVDGKRPRYDGSFHDASIDPERIDAWWSEADYNIGVSPEHAGWGVVDLDPRHGGVVSWNLIVEEKPHTHAVRTPSGGMHLYYAGSLRTSAGKLGEGIDTRGQGGYVLVPPSVVDGKPYVALGDWQPAPLPTWIALAFKPRATVAAATETDLDEPGNVRRAIQAIEAKVAAGATGEGSRNNETFLRAAECRELGCSLGVTLALLAEHWTPNLEGGLDEEELETTVASAYRTREGQNAIGAFATAPAAETFGAALDKLPPSPPAARSKFWPEDEDEQEAGEDPSFLLDEILIEESTVLAVGLTKNYKSFIVQGMALSLATGKPFLGKLPARTGPVFYATLEGKIAVKKARRRAWKIANEVDKVPDFYVMTAPIIALPEEVQEFGDQIKARCAGRRPALIVCETASKMMLGLKENDAGDVARLSVFADSIASAFRCPVVIVHHKGKDGKSYRGSSGLEGNFSTFWDIVANREAKLVQFTVVKHKDAAEPDHPFYLEGGVVGASLAFWPSTYGVWKAAASSEDTLSPKRVGAALKALGAIGEDKAVTSYVLAASLFARAGNEAPEELQALQTKTAQALSRLGGGKLEAYCVSRGRDRFWFLPAP